MNREGLIDLADWARVVRHADGRVEVRQGTSTGSAGAAGGVLVGLLLGLVFLMPFAGMLVGGVAGALIGKLIDYGIDDQFIRDVSHQLTPGTSALFLYVTRVKLDDVVDRFRPYQPSVIHTSLSPEAEEKLRESMRGEVSMEEAFR
jgi:uncharacterized membrane protein